MNEKGTTGRKQLLGKMGKKIYFCFVYYRVRQKKIFKGEIKILKTDYINIL